MDSVSEVINNVQDLCLHHWVSEVDVYICTDCNYAHGTDNEETSYDLKSVYCQNCGITGDKYANT